MSDYSAEITQACTSMDVFFKECWKLTKKFEMQAKSGMCFINNRVEYRMSWNIDYSLRNEQRGSSSFIPGSLVRLAKDNSIPHKFIDPISDDLAHHHTDALAFTNDIFLLCLDASSSFNLRLEDKGPNLLIEYGKYIAGARNPQIVFKQGCFFDTWEDILKFAIRTAVQYEIITTDKFDKQSEKIKFFVQQACQNIPSNNEISSHILKHTLLDHVGEDFSSPNTGISKRKI